MKRKIITVKDTFLIQGRGLGVTGCKEDDSAKIRIGNTVEILRPNNTIIEAQILGIETICNRKDISKIREVENIGFLLKDLLKNDVPKGSIINLLT